MFTLAVVTFTRFKFTVNWVIVFHVCLQFNWVVVSTVASLFSLMLLYYSSYCFCVVLIRWLLLEDEIIMKNTLVRSVAIRSVAA